MVDTVENVEQECVIEPGLGDIVTPEVVAILEGVREREPDWFFYGIVAGSDLPRLDVSMSDLNLQFPSLESATAEYLGFMVESGFYDNYVAHVVSVYDFDELTADEMTLFAIWKSLYVIPWYSKPVPMARVHAYIVEILRQFARHYLDQSGVPGKLFMMESDEYMIEARTYGRNDFHARLIQLEEVEARIDRLIIGARVWNDAYRPLKRRMLELLALGYDVVSVSQLIDIPTRTVQEWVKAFKCCEPDDIRSRIQARTDGSWRWTDHTAHALLSESSVVELLTVEERWALDMLQEHGSLSNILTMGTPDGPRVKRLLRSLKSKVRSGGNRNERGEMTRRAQGKSVIRFVSGLKVATDEDEEMIQAIVEGGGSQAAAARLLGVHKNEITSFLERNGYYRR
jgi:hypothetical protein